MAGRKKIRRIVETHQSAQNLAKNAHRSSQSEVGPTV